MPTVDAEDERSLRHLLFGCIFKEWFRCHNGNPNRERFCFFAAGPTVLTEDGPSTINEVADAHNSHLDQAVPNSFYDEWTVPNLRSNRIFPLFRSIFLVVDEYTPPEYISYDDGDCLDLDSHAMKQTVIMVRTGREDFLSGSISFQQLRDSNLCSELQRGEVDLTPLPIDAVRVSLVTAVRFITDLEKREDAAFPDLRVKPDTQDAEERVDRILRQADEEGHDNVPEVWEAIRAFRAHAIGDFDFRQFLRPGSRDHEHFDLAWR